MTPDARTPRALPHAWGAGRTRRNWLERLTRRRWWQEVARRAEHPALPYLVGALGIVGTLAVWQVVQLRERGWLERELARRGIDTSSAAYHAAMPSAALEAQPAAAPSPVTAIVVGFGSLVSVLLVVGVHAAQLAHASAAERERARLSHAIERPTDGIWDRDLTTGRVARSAALWAHLGYDPHLMALAPDGWSDLIHPEDRGRVEQAMAAHLAGRTDAFDAEYRIRANDGSWHAIIERGRAIDCDRNGSQGRMLGISADITEQRLRELSLRELTTLSTMGRLSARVAHEINNPLAGIQLCFRLIKDAVPSTHPHFKYVGAIEREIARMSAITRQLYETYRPEAELVAHTSVQTVIGDAVALLEQVNRDRRVQVRVALGQSTELVPVPDAVLRQCAYNLIQNAIEAAPDDSCVQVTGAVEDGAYTLAVRDQGAGIAPELHERIFEPFYSTKDASIKTGGMGIGLDLVRRSVHALGGEIRIISPTDGGTEVQVRIPFRTTAMAGSAS